MHIINSESDLWLATWWLTWEFHRSEWSWAGSWCLLTICFLILFDFFIIGCPWWLAWWLNVWGSTSSTLCLSFRRSDLTSVTPSVIFGVVWKRERTFSTWLMMNLNWGSSLSVLCEIHYFKIFYNWLISDNFSIYMKTALTKK